MALLMLAGIIPAVFLVAIGRTWRPVDTEPGSFPTWAGFLAIAQIILIGVVLLVNWGMNDFGSLLALLALPSICALFAESLLYILKALSDFALHREVNALHWPAGLLLSVPLILALLGRLSDPYLLLLIVYGGGLLAFAWLGWERLGKGRFLAYLLLLGLLLAAVWREDTRSQLQFLGTGPASLANLLISAAVGLGCILPIRILGGWLNGETLLDVRKLLRVTLLLTPFILLEGWLGYTASAWDVATDGLGGVFLSQVVGVLGIGGAVLLAWRLPEKRLSAAFSATLVLPIVVFLATSLGTFGGIQEWGKVPHLRTERRAAMIDQAIQRYRQDRGAYPQALSELTPGYLLYLPTPFIIPRQDWCYQGGPAYYRLGYINREYFSTPTSVEIFASAGQPPEEGWECILSNR